MRIGSVNIQNSQHDLHPDQRNKEKSYNIITSTMKEDAQWDKFISQVPGGSYFQSSLWACLRATLGWRCIRLTIQQHDTLVAGAQILIRRLPMIGSIAYVPNGPLITTNESALHEILIDRIFRIVKNHQILHIVIQPPREGFVYDQLLAKKGFQPASITVVPTATLIIDLTKQEEDILLQMKRNTRQKIRRSQRKGITVRDGCREDISSFYQLLRKTSDRGHFPIYPKSYFQELWRIFHPKDHFKLFIAQLNNEIVSALLLLTFGDTAGPKYCCWSGRYSDHSPNEGLHWEAIRWAKSYGFKYYDFEGIDRNCAVQIKEGNSSSRSQFSSYTKFKLGFGGAVEINPPGYEYMPNPTLSFIYRNIYPYIKDSKVFRKIISFIRMSPDSLFPFQRNVIKDALRPTSIDTA